MYYEMQKGILSGKRRLDICHVIVCGNEKGGSGKSTTAMHVAVGLARLGFKVATIDLDTRQKTLTRYHAGRRKWMDSTGQNLITPAHLWRVKDDDAFPEAQDADAEADIFEAQMHRLKEHFDFVVIDTPGAYTRLSIIAHSFADTLLTPVNDSFIDLDVIANVDPLTMRIVDYAHYATTVRDVRRTRRTENGGIIDWIVVRNRLSPISSRNEKRVFECLSEAGRQLGFRLADGIAERVVFREWFYRGLTALDDAPSDNAQPVSMSHIAAKNEVRRLIDVLRLPIDEDGRRRARARSKWLDRPRPEIKLPNIFA